MIFVVDVSQEWIPPIVSMSSSASLRIPFRQSLARQVLTALSDSVQMPCDTRHQVDRNAQQPMVTLEHQVKTMRPCGNQGPLANKLFGDDTGIVAQTLCL